MNPMNNSTVSATLRGHFDQPSRRFPYGPLRRLLALATLFLVGPALAETEARLEVIELRAETAEPAAPLPGGEAGRAALRLVTSRQV